MESILNQAFVERPCHNCGGRYRVTLYDVLQEHRLRQEWSPVRSCSSCAVDNHFLLDSFPADALRAIDEYWEKVAQAARDHEIELRVGE